MSKHTCPACECQVCGNPNPILEDDFLVCEECGDRVYVPDDEEES